MYLQRHCSLSLSLDGFQRREIKRRYAPGKGTFTLADDYHRLPYTANTRISKSLAASVQVPPIIRHESWRSVSPRVSESPGYRSVRHKKKQLNVDEPHVVRRLLNGQLKMSQNQLKNERMRSGCLDAVQVRCCTDSGVLSQDLLTILVHKTQ